MMDLILKESTSLGNLFSAVKKAYPKDWRKIELTPPYQAMGVRKVKFLIGETVYLRTDPDQMERLVTGLIIRPGSNLYLLSSGVETSSHYDFEISPERNVNKSLNIEEK